MDQIHYRDFVIVYAPPPISVRCCDWHATHKDYDGAPDANDNRGFSAISLEELKAQIDGWHDDNAPCLSQEEQRQQATRCACRGHDDWCPCQNVPDRETRSARRVVGEAPAPRTIDDEVRS